MMVLIYVPYLFCFVLLLFFQWKRKEGGKERGEEGRGGLYSLLIPVII